MDNFEGNNSQMFQNRGKWDQQENLRYVLYLNKNKVKFLSKAKGMRKLLFKEMSQFIQSRTPQQCRTHHQKYEVKFGNFKRIIEIYRTEIGEENFKEHNKRLKSQLEKTNAIKQKNPSKTQVSQENIPVKVEEDAHTQSIKIQTEDWMYTNYIQNLQQAFLWNYYGNCGAPFYY